MIVLPSSLGPALERLWEMSASAGVLVLIVLIVLMAQVLLRRWRYALWGVVVLRLLLPVVPGSVTSLANLWPDTAQTATSASAAVRPNTPNGWSVGTLAPDPTATELQSATPLAAAARRSARHNTAHGQCLDHSLGGGRDHRHRPRGLAAPEPYAPG